MRHLLVCAIGVALFACNEPPPPRAIQVSADLPDDVQLAAAIARDAWCAADVGWCPDLVAAGGVPIEIGHWDTEVSADADGAYGHNDRGAYVELSRNWLDSGRATVNGVAVVLVHEFGHFATSDHASEGIFAAEHPYGPDALEPVVDAEARAMWCDAQGC